MNLQKILLSIATIAFSCGIVVADNTEGFRPECYEYYSKIGPGVMIGKQTYKITVNSPINHVLQDNNFVPFQEYKESISLRDENNSDFSFLNDTNKKTFLEIDTRYRTEFDVELEKSTSSGSFDFMMDIDSQFYEPKLSISDDGVNFNTVSVFNVEDFSFKFFRISFISNKDTKEIIKIRELSFKNKSKTYLIKSNGNSHIEIFSSYVCKGNEASFSYPNTEKFDIDIDTKKIGIHLIRNPKLNVFDGIDIDNDWRDDSIDNCLGIYNPKQEDINGDGIGDACSDDDSDGLLGHYDNCPYISNSDQKDINQNGVGDVCEFDKDLDGVPDGIDNCMGEKNPNQEDDDGDNIGNICDNCSAYNPGQIDKNQSSVGDVCEQIEENIVKHDKDKDRIIDSKDNCPAVSNPEQRDLDKDGVGNLCDNCNSIQNPDQIDLNENGTGDMCEDIDDDNFLGYKDNCSTISNTDQKDSDNDGIGDICEDDDNDGILYLNDNCPFSYNKNQKDKDEDGMGDICDKTDDRFLENNKTFFMLLLSLIAIIFLVGIYSLVQKINKK